MKKGLLFIFIIAAIYWGYYFIYRKPAKPIVTARRISAPIENAGDITHEANRNILETSIEIFYRKEGRYPDRLEELVEKDYLSGLPDSGSRDWEYNSGKGQVN